MSTYVYAEHVNSNLVSRPSSPNIGYVLSNILIGLLHMPVCIVMVYGRD